jgi:hypothetical protein
MTEPGSGYVTLIPPPGGVNTSSLLRMVEFNRVNLHSNTPIPIPSAA